MRRRTGPSPRARCRCSAPSDPARQGAEGIRVQPAPCPGVGLPEKARNEGGAGHDQHPGPWRGQKIPTTCWQTGWSSCCGHWQPWRGPPIENRPRSGCPASTILAGRIPYLSLITGDTSGTLPPASTEKEASIDWSDKRARQALLAGIVADAVIAVAVATLALNVRGPTVPPPAAGVVAASAGGIGGGQR